MLPFLFRGVAVEDPKAPHEEGHGDLKDAPWWPKMKTRQELIESCTIIIWVGSALHSAVNFGQYPYGGYLLNPEWTADREPLEAFKKFGRKLEVIQDRMFDMNKDVNLKNRVGPVK
ncbi:hypothetical protein DKX38_019393 [Salix brachista]|uniref:Lipoxygenase domain-containing protein n=1 Tax=Salix brachista TaxID=2182728 RepID=A0A5N5KG34_9ROSI|nr:hypothetical protein DKX38_019393 [Salix brachista]